jgi:hypothetical protein
MEKLFPSNAENREPLTTAEIFADRAARVLRSVQSQCNALIAAQAAEVEATGKPRAAPGWITATLCWVLGEFGMIDVPLSPMQLAGFEPAGTAKPDLLSAFRAVADAAGDAWDGVDAEAFVREQRGDEPADDADRLPNGCFPPGRGYRGPAVPRPTAD